MVFSSHLFFFYFLPTVLVVYYLLPRRARHLGLTLLSYLFYGWANPLFVFLMLASTTVDYFCGLAISGAWRGPAKRLELLPGGAGRRRSQRLAVAVSVISNLSLLGFFKYFNFAVESYASLVTTLGLPHLQIDQVLRVTLPLGISFYTFQSMSYTIDIYRGHARALRNPIDFACFVSLFPQLVAGPILRFSQLEDQLRSRHHSLEKIARGIAMLSLGMAKKVLLANPCGKLADVVFDAGSASVIDAWLGLLAYSFQIYFDFSGYSDMAIGLGLMLGFVFPKNFDSPYRAKSITDFWRRWHISLSTWLRDYLYLPLGGNRAGPRRTYFNLMLVMVLGGLWHGAAWNFVFWGLLHGGLLALERARGKRSLFAATPPIFQVAGTFGLVLLTWVPFRAHDLSRALDYYRELFGFGSPQDGAALLGGVIHQPYYLGTLVLAALVAFFGSQSWDFSRRMPAWKAGICLALLALSLVALSTQAYNPFIYFIF